MSGGDHNQGEGRTIEGDPVERVVEALAGFWPVRSAFIGGVHESDRDKWLLDVAVVAVNASRGEVSS